MKVAILHQGFVPDYRVRFFELLNRGDDSEYVVFHGDPPSDSGHEASPGPFDFPNVHVRNREFTVANKALIYQPVIRRLIAENFDAVVIGSHLQFVSNHFVLAARKLTGRPVLYWGHGNEKGSGVGLKYRLAHLSDGYLVYTQAGARRLLANGMPSERVTVVPNTLDMSGQELLADDLVDASESALREELGLRSDTTVLVYLGRIYPTKRVDDLVRAVRQLNSEQRPERPLEVVVIGDGPSAAAVRSEAADVPNVRFIGGVRDQPLIAKYLRVAAATVMPGVVGLVANHALAHGVPLIHQESPIHSPEMEYLTPGKDLVVAPDLESFADALADFADSPARQEEMAAHALAARSRISLDTMVDAFELGVRETVERVRS